MAEVGGWDEAIARWVKDHRDDLVAHLARLVQIPSENRVPHGDEAQAQAYLRSLLASFGCTVDAFRPDEPQGVKEHPAFMKGRDYRERPCVVGVRRGTGGGRSLLISGHVDTVPRGIDPWTKPVFGGVVEGGRLYGLGACDMKAGLMAGVMAIRCLHELGFAGRGDVMVESVVDEEFGGANGTLACRVKGYAADIAIVPEPTNMAICPAHRGGTMFRATFEGRAGHFVGSELSSSRTPNPIAAAAHFVALLEAFNEARNRREVPQLYADNPHLPMEIVQIAAGDLSFAIGDRNPSRCFLTVWMEVDPDTSEEAFYRELQAFLEPRLASDPVLAHMRPTIEPQIRFLEGSAMAVDHPAVSALRQVVRDVTATDVPVRGAPFACDGFMFNRYSPTPALFLGPRGGGAHATDEYVELEDYLALVEIFARFAVQWTS